jgi:hypothetical protein
MRTVELETVVRDKLKSAGVGPALVEEKGQFLETPEGFFAEIVLNDGSKLPAVERVVRSVKEELKDKGVQLDAIVRAVWRVSDIRFIGPARSVSGGLKAALEFAAVLESGDKECNVTVEVTLAALNRLRQKLALAEKVGFPGWSKEGDVDEDTLRKTVAEFLDFQLSIGGASYWDPLRFPKVELQEATVSYLMPDTKTFTQLSRAIDRFLGDYALEYSLKELALRSVKIHDFERVLPDLSNHLAGAFRPGERVATNALSLFQALGELERKRLEQYYSQKVREVPENLKNKYSGIFVR